MDNIAIQGLFYRISQGESVTTIIQQKEVPFDKRVQKITCVDGIPYRQLNNLVPSKFVDEKNLIEPMPLLENFQEQVIPKRKLIRKR